MCAVCVGGGLCVCPHQKGSSTMDNNTSTRASPVLLSTTLQIEGIHCLKYNAFCRKRLNYFHNVWIYV